LSPNSIETWQEQNREYLVLAIDDLDARMDEGEPDPDVRMRLSELYERMEFAPAILTLAESFGLGGFEHDVVLLCAAGELDPRFRGDARHVTLGLALESLPGAHWSALDASAPLRRWEIVELQSEVALADAELRLSADILRYLLGFDPRTGPGELFTLQWRRSAPLPRQAKTARDLARAIALTSSVQQRAPAVELYGARDEDRLALAEACAEELGKDIATGDARDLPSGPDLEHALARWNRICRLTGTLLLINASGSEDEPTARHHLARALDRVEQPLFISIDRPATDEPTRPLVRREVAPLTADERASVWTVCVDASCTRLRIRPTKKLRDELDALSTQFRLSAAAIDRIALEAESLQAAERAPRSGAPAADRLAKRLREGCWHSVRARLDPLAERVPLESTADTVLPELERTQLHQLELEIRLTHLVNERWGFGRGRSAGLTALFAGPSGTGKTHSAMALARRLGLDLYRVNVAAVLSKYIGETEQNLDRIFDAASIGGVILLFDEADALFGKRSEVKDAHDRYANIGTAYLLQRIENAPTPTILTTNLKEGIDRAFTRRLHFVIDFPFPSRESREEIWRSIFPPRTPTRRLKPELLARLAVSGGTISNIARRAAFLAAADTGHVEMHHVRDGAMTEALKTDTELAPEETAGWV
jgi:hypothetical protein